VSILGFVGEIYFEDKVVAHFKDGRVVKGHTNDFSPERDDFLLQPYVSGPTPVSVRLEELKAVFHVRTFEGNPDHGPSPEGVGEIPDERFRNAMQRARKALLEFSDGERMWGFAEGLESANLGFFFFPTDPDSNNLRIYVIRSALKDMILLDR
jgi:uncharacterized protein DUF6982